MLKKTTKPIKVMQICGFDTETYGRYNRFLLGSISFNSGTETFMDKESMKKRLLSLSGYHVFATNLMFDFFAIFDYKDDYSGMDFLFHNGNLLKVTYKKDGEKVIFLDTMNYCKQSVERMGQIINHHKLKSPDFLGRKPKNAEQMQELIEYNKRDSQISRRYMERLQDKLNRLGCELKTTISATAMDLWNREFYNPLMHPIFKISDKEERLMRKCYYGGRTECFYRGCFEKPLKLYDINSMYPKALTFEYPDTKKMYRIASPEHSYINSFGFSYADIEAPEDLFYPFLPYRNAEDKLIFPLGRFKGYYTHIELKEAERLGYKITLLKSYIFPKSYYPFAEYVSKLYQLRNSDKDYSDVYKILLNSLYGKFAQRTDKIQCFIPESCMTDNDFKLFSEDDQGDIENGFYIFKKEMAKPDYIMPIFSAYVTSYSRILLYKYLTKYKAVYCDTDSILTERSIRESSELGRMKLERISSRSILIKPKFYYLYSHYDIIKAKGIRHITKPEFLNLLRGKSVKQMKFCKFREALRRNLKVNEILRFAKYMDLEDDKREWHGKFGLNKWQKSTPIIIDSGSQ